MNAPRWDQNTATQLLRDLVAIPSLSRQEAEAAAWLVGQMLALGYERAYVDDAGNAVGEIGATDAHHTVVLLGHIDTVPGAIPVRIEETPAGAALFGRGSVDAKGALATFVMATARLGAAWARDSHTRVVVVGAVEEEAATSKGARFIRDRFDGIREPIPHACVIGEPSSAHRVTLGYKGRLLVEAEAWQPMMHTAGPDAGIATLVVDLWNWLAAYAANFNADRERTFDQLSPSLRRVHTSTDDAMQERVSAQIGIRLPLEFDVAAFVDDLLRWARRRVEVDATAPHPAHLPPSTSVLLAGPSISLDLSFRGYETAWRSDRDTPLVRSFLAAIRALQPGVRPGFVVKSGTSDMNVVGPAWQCPLLAYGPGDSSLDHTPHEHVLVDELWQAVLVLEQALRNLPPLLS